MLLHCLRLMGFVALLWVVPALAQSSPPAPAWVAALRDGGHIIVVRHGATYADQADTNPLVAITRSVRPARTRDLISGRHSSGPNRSTSEWDVDQA